jgi:hypothetical protein
LALFGAECVRLGDQIVQGRRGQGQDLNIEAGFVHESDPLPGEIKQAPLDLARVDGNAGVCRRQPDRIPGIAHLRGQIMFLDADQVHALISISHVLPRPLTTDRPDGSDST